MTVQKQDILGQSGQTFDNMNRNQEEILYGTALDGLNSKILELTRSYLFIKAASYSDNQHITNLTIPEHTSWPKAHFLLKSLIEIKEKNVFYEWAQLLIKKQQAFPANIMGYLLDWASKDLKIADVIQPCIGNLGNYLSGLFPQYAMLSNPKQAQPLSFSKNEQSLFAFKWFRKTQPEKALRYFIDHYKEIKESEKPKWLKILKNGIDHRELPLLIALIGGKKTALQLELIYLHFCVPQTEFYAATKSAFQNSLNNNALQHFKFQWLPNASIDFTKEQTISYLPLQFLENEKQYRDYIEWILHQDLEESLQAALLRYPSNDFSNFYFNFLLEQNELTEDRSTAILSSGMDHISFNKACLKWISYAEEKLDVEAFYHFINSEKLFWSDELLLKIINLRNHKTLDRKYDFNVFWQLLPFKIDPNSDHVKNIPKECKINFNSFITFESILSFRKTIRSGY